MSWQFATAGQVLFGRGCSSRIVEVARRTKVSKALVVTDEQLVCAGLIAPIIDQLKSSGIPVSEYTGCRAEPPVSCATDAVSAARGAGCDGVIAVGGGSNMDVGKMAAVLLSYGGEPKSYFGYDRIPGPVLPMIAVPTTAGTGSEVSHSSVLTDTEAGVKVSSLSRHLRPTAAVVDPALTDTCPATVTAHSGIDALVHAIEAYTARNCAAMPEPDPLARAYDGANPFTKVLASEAIRLVGRSLVRAFQDGSDQAARDNMALAAMLAGMAFSNSGVAVVHALEYPIGVLTHCSHGEGNGLLLPHVMRFNAQVREQEIIEIGKLLSGTESTTEEMSSAETTIALIEQLQSALKIRTQLRDLNLDRSALRTVAEKAHSIQRLMDTNPRSPSVDDLIGILEAAY